MPDPVFVETVVLDGMWRVPRQPEAWSSVPHRVV
jgi:hypothetical protein